MSKNILCDQCGQAMEQVFKKTVQGKKSKYRFRRFHCDLCDYTKAIFANGFFDTDLSERMAKDHAKKMLKQQSKNESFAHELNK